MIAVSETFKRKRRPWVWKTDLLLRTIGLLLWLVASGWAALKLPALGWMIFVQSTPQIAEPSSGQQSGDTPVVGWKVLRGLDYHTGAKTAELARLEGTVVSIPGYIVPLEDETDAVSEFLLVPYLGACIHVPPPPANQMVQVHVSSGKKKLSLWDAVLVEGKLNVGASQSAYGNAAYSMNAQRISPYRQ